MRRLTRDLDADCTFLDLDRSLSRVANSRNVWDALQRQAWDLVYMESTGIAAGLPLIRAAWSNGQRYIVSSGDPIGGFFHAVRGPLHGFVFERYERLLYRYSVGFVGWTPYLAGAAIQKGAPHAVTVEGAVDLDLFTTASVSERRSLKQKYGIDPDHIVLGMVGSLKWTPRQSYCYGLELTSMLQYVNRDDLSVLIVGDGDGRERIQARIPPAWADRVVFTGRVPEHEVVPALHAMDVGFITQTLDRLGNFRLTTKLPEYLAAGLPVAMSPIPGFYDYARDVGWSLPPHHPATDAFHRKCGAWANRLTREEIAVRRPKARQLAEQVFDYEVVRPRFTEFVHDLLNRSANSMPVETTNQSEIA